MNSGNTLFVFSGHMNQPISVRHFLVSEMKFEV